MADYHPPITGADIDQFEYFVLIVFGLALVDANWMAQVVWLVTGVGTMMLRQRARARTTQEAT